MQEFSNLSLNKIHESEVLKSEVLKSEIPEKDPLVSELSTKFPQLQITIKDCDNCPCGICICCEFDDFYNKPEDIRTMLVDVSFFLVNKGLEKAKEPIRYTKVQLGKFPQFATAYMVHQVSKKEQSVSISLPINDGLMLRTKFIWLLSLTNVPIALCLGSEFGKITSFRFGLSPNGESISEATVSLQRSTSIKVDFLAPGYSFYHIDGTMNKGAFLQFIYKSDNDFFARTLQPTCPICLHDFQPKDPMTFIETVCEDGTGGPQAIYCRKCIETWLIEHNVSPTTRERKTLADIKDGVVPSEEDRIRLHPVRSHYDQSRAYTVPVSKEDREEQTRLFTSVVGKVGRVMSRY